MANGQIQRHMDQEIAIMSKDTCGGTKATDLQQLRVRSIIVGSPLIRGVDDRVGINCRTIGSEYKQTHATFRYSLIYHTSTTE